MADSSGAMRAADVLLRTAGGRSVMLRMAAPAVAGSDGEQLGLVAAEFQDAELGPVVFRTARGRVAGSANGDKAVRWELLVSATAVNGLMGGAGFASAAEMFAGAVGVVVDGVLWAVESVTESEVFGAAYVYRVGVKGPEGLVV